MEQVTDAIGNPITLLLERMFWLGLGGFLGLALITSLLRTQSNKSNKKTKPFSTKELENLAKKVTQERIDSN
tara:strand:+ start:202 stop:417 length:216 start_codon:yes stop_codon:yes gene_type:complete